MTTKFGWCFGPEGVVVHHETCPAEVSMGGAVMRCGCWCHESASDRTFPLQEWENGDPTTNGPRAVSGPVALTAGDGRGPNRTGLEFD